MIPPPAGGGTAPTDFHVFPEPGRRFGTAEAGLLMREPKGAGHGPAFRRGPRQVVG